MESKCYIEPIKEKDKKPNCEGRKKQQPSDWTKGREEKKCEIKKAKKASRTAAATTTMSTCCKQANGELIKKMIEKSTHTKNV